MNINQRIAIVWAAKRIAYLDSLKSYEDSYAVSQEFCEWTTCLNVYPEGLKSATLDVPNFNKENRTSQSTQS
tara:strand:- start:78 stop:293 length:216 start_codon:yes stop_codon:yes gene_type:complete